MIFYCTCIHNFYSCEIKAWKKFRFSYLFPLFKYMFFHIFICIWVIMGSATSSYGYIHLYNDILCNFTVCWNVFINFENIIVLVQFFQGKWWPLWMVMILDEKTFHHSVKMMMHNFNTEADRSILMLVDAFDWPYCG